MIPSHTKSFEGAYGAVVLSKVRIGNQHAPRTRMHVLEEIFPRRNDRKRFLHLASGRNGRFLYASVDGHLFHDFPWKKCRQS